MNKIKKFFTDTPISVLLSLAFVIGLYVTMWIYIAPGAIVISLVAGLFFAVYTIGSYYSK